MAVPDYLLKYPQIQLAVPRVHSLLKQLPPQGERPLFSDGQFELEARFGTIANDGRNTFQPGVTREFLEHCLQCVSLYEDWKAVKDWEQTHDYYYELPPHPEDLRGKGILVRTSVSFVKEGGDEEAHIVTKHMCKHVRDKYDFRYVSGARFAGAHMPHPGMDIRVGLNFEETIPADSVATNIPPRVQPKFVRIKNRKSFIYQPAHSAVPLWSIDFTKSWSAATRSEAELKQKSGQTVYEIEVECLDPYMYMNDPRRDQFYLATSLMLKMRDFIGSDSQFHWDPVYRYV